MASGATSFPKQSDFKVVPTVQARPVATPMQSRRAISPARARFNADQRLPPTAAVVAVPGSANTPGAPPTGKPPPVIVHAFSAQSLPSLSAVSAHASAMCRSRSFTGEITHSTPRFMQCSRQVRSNAGSWVPPPMPSAATALSYAPPPALHNATVPGGAMSWAPPPVSPAGTAPVLQFPLPFQGSPMQLTRGLSSADLCKASVIPSLAPGVEVVMGVPSYAPMQATDGDPDEYHPGTEVVIGSHRFRCVGVLGRGSFSEVWSGEELGTKESLEVALKDIQCNGQSDLQQCLFEPNMLKSFAFAAKCSYAQGAPPPQLRIPFYLSHRVDQRRDGKPGNRIRMAMTRVPGEPVDAFLKRPPPPGQDVQSAVRRGCMLAMALIRQLGPTLELVSQKAIHRDVNAHNVLLSDAIDGGPFKCNVEPEEVFARASFWLIDFGLAVDSTTWHSAWREADIGGDCRYWPQSSWFVSFWGADEIAAKQHLCNQYLNRLDIFGLGITALELLCTTALDGSNAAGCQNGSSDGLRGSWRRLLNAWSKYWTDVTRWHTMIYRVFSLGGDVGPLYQELAKERVVDKILNRMAQIRQCLQACVNRTEDPRIQKLLSVLAEMLDESSSFGLREAVEMLGGECPTALRQQRSSNNSSLPSKPTLPCPATPGVSVTAPPSLAQVTVQAISAQAAATRVAAQSMAAHAAATARARVDAAQFEAHQKSEAFRACMEDPAVQALRWQPPPMQNNSFAPPILGYSSFVPPAVSNQSFVPPAVPALPNNGSYVPAPLAHSGSYAPPPAFAQTETKGKVVQPAPSRPVRPQRGGA
mmetsp:Transcript_1815/g.3137  ORF Transcript_1815/g.3137 Transcript_1815/m.3137 type:complete len:812 (+) Transcript_1815:57-2492(+)|eukprot:CAMPEP_0169348292 /NCGR_PEP_ID=MMETSP1017-20121227/23098_1 /TAXON_ID=342587 /ORGANISM="Karlodinium micrum, Strain CCMP2283" /LENGTH=811 /DNA_ID=CAMNT_0009444337 /DNA_START=49 /DNA_END=2484 /DNA_ORIENTATION=-